MKPIYHLMAIPVIIMACNSTPSYSNNDSGTITTDSAMKVTKTVTTPKKQPSADWLIIPGKSIGKVTLGENADSVFKALGDPDLTDGAMGSSLLTWVGKNGDSTSHVSVFTQRDMGGPDETVSRVKQIRITSSKFKTAEGIGTGATLANLNATYSIKTVDKYKQLKVYDDLQHGIAFDVDSITSRCVAISVYAPFNRNAAHMNLR